MSSSWATRMQKFKVCRERPIDWCTQNAVKIIWLYLDMQNLSEIGVQFIDRVIALTIIVNIDFYLYSQYCINCMTQKMQFLQLNEQQISGECISANYEKSISTLFIQVITDFSRSQIPDPSSSSSHNTVDYAIRRRLVL